ncbi:hypothetical protein ES705_34971 [subsurface metagenome]
MHHKVDIVSLHGNGEVPTVTLNTWNILGRVRVPETAVPGRPLPFRPALANTVNYDIVNYERIVITDDKCGAIVPVVCRYIRWADFGVCPCLKLIV